MTLTNALAALEAVTAEMESRLKASGGARRFSRKRSSRDRSSASLSDRDSRRAEEDTAKRGSRHRGMDEELQLLELMRSLTAEPELELRSEGGRTVAFSVASKPSSVASHSTRLSRVSTSSQDLLRAWGRDAPSEAEEEEVKEEEEEEQAKKEEPLSADEAQAASAENADDVPPPPPSPSPSLARGLSASRRRSQRGSRRRAASEAVRPTSGATPPPVPPSRRPSDLVGGSSKKSSVTLEQLEKRRPRGPQPLRPEALAGARTRKDSSASAASDARRRFSTLESLTAAVKRRSWVVREKERRRTKHEAAMREVDQSKLRELDQQTRAAERKAAEGKTAERKAATKGSRSNKPGREGRASRTQDVGTQTPWRVVIVEDEQQSELEGDYFASFSTERLRAII